MIYKKKRRNSIEKKKDGKEIGKRSKVGGMHQRGTKQGKVGNRK